MSFAPVKTCPYTKRRRRRIPKFRLWSDDEWKRIVLLAENGYDWVGYVTTLNRRLYGTTPDKEL